MATTYEEKILTLSTKIPFLEEDKNPIQDILSHKIDWHILINLASLCGILPLMAKNLLGIDNDSVPKSLLEDNFNQHKIEYILNDLVFWEEIKKIIKITKQKQIPIIPFKGVVLKSMLYDNLGLIRTSDIDILVKKEHLPEIESSLVDLGYTLKEEEAKIRDFVLDTHFHFIFYKKTPSEVLVRLEVHWDILPYVMRINNLVRDFWNNAELKMVLGENVLTLSLEDLLFESIIEVYKEITYDRFLLIKHHLDISQLLQIYGQKINWDEFIRRTHSYGISNLVYYVLSANKKFFNHDIPAQDILDKIKPSFIKRALILKTIKNLNSLERDISYPRYLLYLFISEVILLNRFNVFLWKTLYLFYPKIMLYKKNKRIKYILFTTFELFYRLIRKIIRNYVRREAT